MKSCSGWYPILKDTKHKPIGLFYPITMSYAVKTLTQTKALTIIMTVDVYRGPSLRFTKIRPKCVGDFGTMPKNSKKIGLALKIAILYFLALSPTSLKNV
jgi:hypothetical protein